MTLVWLTLAVALLHLALLEGLPNVASTFQAEKPAQALGFSIRTVPAAPVESLPPVVTAKPTPSRTTPKKPALPKLEPVVPPEPGHAATTSPAAPTDSMAGIPANSDIGSSVPIQGNPTDTAQTADTAGPSTAAPPSFTSAPTSAAAPDGQREPDRKLVLPPSVRMAFDVKGVVTFAYTGGSELLWLNHGNAYHARLQITKFGFNMRTWTSKGDLTEQGVAPLRFGDKGRSSEIASHFQRDKGIISFSANTPDANLQPGAQDYLSSFFQLSAMLSGEPERYPPGSAIAFQVAGARSADPWIFHVDGEETLDLPDGPKATIRLTRQHDATYDTKVELWLAPDLSFLPLRIRLSQTNGDFAELLWRSSQKPD
jgi:hypothetical protein